MSYVHAIKLLTEPLRSLGFAAIGAAYAGIGTALDHPARIIRIQNLTDATLFFSFDGINDHEIMIPNSFILLDINSNKATEHGFYLSEGTRIYVKRSGVPSSGSVYVAVYYGFNE
jgi:hypothetical protein